NRSAVGFIELSGRTGKQTAELHLQERKAGGKPGVAITSAERNTARVRRGVQRGYGHGFLHPGVPRLQRFVGDVRYSEPPRRCSFGLTRGGWRHNFFRDRSLATVAPAPAPAMPAVGAVG